MSALALDLSLFLKSNLGKQVSNSWESVTGSLIQNTEMVEFQDGLRKGFLPECFLGLMYPRINSKPPGDVG